MRYTSQHVCKHFKTSLVMQFWDADVPDVKVCEVCGEDFTAPQPYDNTLYYSKVADPEAWPTDVEVRKTNET